MSEQPLQRINLRVLATRLVERLDLLLQKRHIQWICIALVSGVIALLVGPPLSGSESMTARLRLGMRAETNIKAARDFNYVPSDQHLNRLRDVSELQVLPVFDHHADAAAVLLSRVNRAFEVVAAESTEMDKPLRHRMKLADAPSDKAPPIEKLTTAELRSQFAKNLGADVPSSLFEAIRRSEHSSEIRASMVILLGTALDHLIVSHRSALAPYAARPIAIRHLVGGRVGVGGEERWTETDRIKDLSQVLDQVRHQSNVHAAKLPPSLRNMIVSVIESLVQPNLTYNEEESNRRKKAARTAITAQRRFFAKGEVIVTDGTPITAEHLRILEAMEEGYPGLSSGQLTVLGIALLVFVVLVVVQRFAVRQLRWLDLKPRDFFVMGMLLVVMVGVTRIAVVVVGEPGRLQAPLFPYALPIAAGAMLVRLVVNAQAASLFAVVNASLCALLLDRNLGLMLCYLLTALVGAGGLSQMQTRSHILRAGIMSGLAGAIIVAALSWVSGNFTPLQVFYAIFSALIGGLLAAFVTLALLPALEWFFGYTTDVSLLELANLNHPLLRDLMLRAPGTYHHSMVVGSLSEAACEAVGANGLLARVSCNYHDVGKMKNAAYFAENFAGGENPHLRLKPSMSSLIIRNHVKDTIEMLKEHGIPDLVINTATQHHGTTLIEFFYHKALEQKDPDEEVHEEDYRYPGPKPQTREAGILMLADAVEASARSLPEPTEDRLRALVQRIINRKFTDGQLDHCDLTLRDLHLIARSFLQVLRGIYHHRPSYPWQRDRADDTRRGSGEESGRRQTGIQQQFVRGEKRDDKRDDKRDTKEPKDLAADAQIEGAAPRAEPPNIADDQAAANVGTTAEDPPSSPKDIKRLGLN